MSVDGQNVDVAEILRSSEKTTIRLKRGAAIYRLRTDEQEAFALLRDDNQRPVLIGIEDPVRVAIGLAPAYNVDEPSIEAERTRVVSIDGRYGLQARYVAFVDETGKPAYAVYDSRNSFVLICRTADDAASLAHSVLKHEERLEAAWLKTEAETPPEGFRF